MRARQATHDDLPALVNFPIDTAVRSVDADRLREELAEDRMRPQWSWVVEDDDGSIVGRALWWGRSDSRNPQALDCLHVLDQVDHRIDVAADLLRRAHQALADNGRPKLPEYNITLAQGWHDDEAAIRAVEWRIAAAGAAGLTEQVERLRYEWSSNRDLPLASQRVRFRPGDEREFLTLFRQVAADTLDATTQRALAVMDPQVQAQDDYDFYLNCSGERGWWRIATTVEGTPVGFIVPSATPYSRNVGYLGVLPSFRGHGLVNDLLAEITRIHADDGADRITATTDLTNRPMAAAFDRAGYRVTEVRMVLEEPASSPTA